VEVLQAWCVPRLRAFCFVPTVSTANKANHQTAFQTNKKRLALGRSLHVSAYFS
jgi:hypothetical protein